MKNHGKTVVMLLLGVAVYLLPTGGSCAWTAASNDDDDAAYDFSWLDPDKKIYVLQNRRYTKAMRPMVSLLGGFGLSGPYVNSYLVNPRLGYYLTEAWGLEVSWSFNLNKRSTTFDALNQSSSTAIPRIREIQNELAALLHWSPWYAKINVFNNVLYFDWYFSLGAGQIATKLDLNEVKNGTSNFVDQSFFAIFWGTGHQYHLSSTWTARLDLLGAFYSAPLLGTTGESTFFSNYQFTFGVGMRI